MEFIALLNDYPQYAGLLLIILMMMESAPVTGFFFPVRFFCPYWAR